jgi:sulfite dehydrogenase (cytochrome) subunit B
MHRFILLIGVCAATRVTGPAFGESAVAYNPPIETAALKEAPGVEVANVNCRTCHSADYITSQPRGAGFGKEFWQGEVTKMIKAYGAQITESDAKIVIDYLSAAYR